MTERAGICSGGFLCGRIYNNHIKQYEFAKQYISGKNVLDIACIEGYGTFTLSFVVESVVGVRCDVYCSAKC